MMMPPVGKSGPGTIFISSSSVVSGFGDQRQRGVDDLAEVVRRDVGRHADGDAVGAVDQQVRESAPAGPSAPLRSRRSSAGNRRCPCRCPPAAAADALGQPHLGVAHRRRVVAVDRAEIALAVDQRQAHGEVLRHADHGVVDRGVAVRVVFTHDVADDAGRLAVRLVRRVAGFVHPYRMRRCTGFRPSRASGSARATITLMA